MTKPMPEKPLSERIAKRFSDKKSSVSAQNLASFLALKEEVSQSLNDGWKCKHIWDTLFDEGKIAFSYPTFNTYVKKLIRPPVKIKDEQNNLEEPKETPKQNKSGFTFNSVPNIKELI